MIPSSVTEIDGVQRELLRCHRCWNVIPKPKRMSWKQYSGRKYCNAQCASLKNSPLECAKDELPISDYIGSSTYNGKLMADLYIGILVAVREQRTTATCMECGHIHYNGVRITSDMLKAAAEWLTVNWLGKPGQRNTSVAEIELSRDELIAGLRALENC